jgi:hypothetical protein
MSAPEAVPFTPAGQALQRQSRRASWATRHQHPRQLSISAFANTSTAASHPVELQVETMSSISTRVFLYTWYAVLIVALVVESNVSLQWVSRNFCGDATVSAYHLDDWNSTSCLSWEAYWARPAPADVRDLKRGALHRAELRNGGDHELEGSSYMWVAWPPEDDLPDSDPYTPVTNSDGIEAGRRCSRSRLSLSPTSSSLQALKGSRLQSRICSTPLADTATHTSTPPPRPTMPPVRHVYKLRWTAEGLSGVLDHELNRFLHVFISLASPLTDPRPTLWDTDDEETLLEAQGETKSTPSPPQPVPWKVYEVLVALEEASFEPDDLTATLHRRGNDGTASAVVPSASFRTLSSSSSFRSSSSSSSIDAASSSAGRNDTSYIYTYKASVTCWRTALRCSNIVLPANVVIPTNRSRLTITLINVEAELAEATVRAATAASFAGVAAKPEGHLDHSAAFASTGCIRLPLQRSAGYSLKGVVVSSSSSATTGVGVMYQRAQYTITTIVFRYLFLAITAASALHFLYRSRQAGCMLYEQKWTLALQLGLILYLNPLYWWCIYTEGNRKRGGNTAVGAGAAPTFVSLATGRVLPFASLWRFSLYYIEFHIPTYFVALTVCYIWGVIAGSFCWSSAVVGAPSSFSPAAAATANTAVSGPTDPHAARVEATVRSALASGGGDGASPTEVSVPLTLTISASQLARRRVRMLLVFFMCTVAVLDTAKCFFEDGGLSGGWSEVTCRTPNCLKMQQVILYVLVGGILSSGVGLYWLRRNLARHPYLSTRPQQLACRIMIFIYFTGGLYCVVQALLLEAFYAQLMAIIYYQPLVQLSHLFALTSFVNHMTYVYTATQSSLQIPLRPSDPRWKTVGWSSRWYRWLDWHGGSLYVFYNEAEERKFYEVQVAYQLAKREREEQCQRRRRRERGEVAQRDGRCQTASAPPCGVHGDGQDNASRNADAVTAQRSRQAPLHRICPPSLKESQGKRSASAGGDPKGSDDVTAGTCKEAASRGVASLQPPPFPPRLPLSAFALSTTTLSALSEAEGADWVLPPEGDGLLGRHRSLSTVTQLSSNALEGSEEHHHRDPHEYSEGRGEGEVHSPETQHDSQHSRAQAETHTPSSATSGVSPFPPSAMPVTVIDDVVADGGRDSVGGGGGNNTLAAAKGRHASQHVLLSRVSSRVLVALHGAESRLVDGTATFVDLLAEKCVDRPLQVLLRQRAHQRLVFFNLETAIDCLNLSREAYAVQESKGDDLIHTGIQVDAGEVPRAALTLVERALVALLGLCFKQSPLEPSVVETATSSSVVVAAGNGAGVHAGVAEVDDEQDSDEHVPLLQQAQGAAASTPSTHACVDGKPEETQGGGTPLKACAAGKAAGSWSRVAAFMKGEGDEAGLTPPEEVSQADAAAFTPTRQKPCASLSAATTPPTAPPSPQALLLPHMNVMQYGYTPVAVFDTRGVQVVIARMDVSGACPVHTGKYPRLTIAFRGTDNVANVLEDIRFRQRTWKEMETPTLLLPRARVHSGFLELWMSLKEAVMNVVLRELHSQHASCQAGTTHHNSNSGGNNGGDGRGGDGGGDRASEAATAAGVDAPRRDIFSSVTPFSTRWAASPCPCTHDHRSGFLRVYVTGHSLGGAIACLCAYSLRRMLLLIEYPEPDLVVYTFGQPRIGNSVFKQHYNRAIPCTFRVVNESDVVSGFNILGGHHVGVQVNVDRHGNYVCKPMSIERLLRPTRGRGLALLNHKLTAYANSLNAVADVNAAGACPVRCLGPYLDAIESVSSSEVGDEPEDQTEHAATKAEAKTAGTADGLPQREELEEAERESQPL